jgi:hypothetical protein
MFPVPIIAILIILLPPIKETPLAELQSVMVANTLKMAELGLVDFKNIIDDSTPIFANTNKIQRLPLQ